MKHIIMFFVLLLLNIKYTSLTGLKKNSSTLIYVVLVNVGYYLLCGNHLLWKFNPGLLKLNTARFLQTFLSTPLLINLFLTYLPRSPLKLAIYIFKWTISSTFFEHLANKKLNMIYFQHGWSIFWSGLIYFLMFLFSFFHTKNKKTTWVLSFLTSVFLLRIFKVPFDKSSIKNPIISFKNIYLNNEHN